MGCIVINDCITHSQDVSVYRDDGSSQHFRQFNTITNIYFS